MHVLVADVGGTNSRLALATSDGPVESTLRNYENSAFDSFYDVARVYLREANPGQVETCSIAMAGPVSAGFGRLTNRAWDISEAGLKEVTNCSRAFLMNDLTALGYSLRHLHPDGVAQLCGTQRPAFENGQALVVGIGTGFNVCPVKITRTGETCCFEAEAGHTGLPAQVALRLNVALADASNEFATVEDLFSGRGLAQLGIHICNGKYTSAREIAEAHLNYQQTDASAVLSLYSELLGLFCKELVLAYLPRNGIFLAGSVGRGVFGAGFHEKFSHAFQDNPQPDPTLGQVPVSVILDDAAALYGCAVAGAV